jgi:hypothetical protein
MAVLEDSALRATSRAVSNLDMLMGAVVVTSGFSEVNGTVKLGVDSVLRNAGKLSLSRTLTLISSSAAMVNDGDLLLADVQLNPDALVSSTVGLLNRGTLSVKPLISIRVNVKFVATGSPLWVSARKYISKNLYICLEVWILVRIVPYHYQLQPL